MKKIFIIFICLLFVGCSSDSKQSNILNEIKPINYDNYDFLNENIDTKFLTWFEEKYPDELNKIIKLIDKNEYTIDSWHNISGNSLNTLMSMYNKEQIQTISTDSDINIKFVGDISLADNFDIMPYYDSRNNGVYGILSKEIVDIMQSADIMIANNEFTISDRGTPLNKTYTFRATPTRLKIYHEMGVDLVSLANNHIYDYGIDAFYDSLQHLEEYNINYVGAGKNINEASQPFYYIVNGYKIAFISATRAEKNIITPAATETDPGVFRVYNNSLLLEKIKEVSNKSDYTVLLIHWGTEFSTILEDVQLQTSKAYIDAGASLIVGGHAHTLQGMEYYKNKLIAYNLGDFIFNSESKDTGILNLNISKDGKLTYSFIPCFQSNYKTELSSNKETVFKKINDISINAYLDSMGKIVNNS